MTGKKRNYSYTPTSSGPSLRRNLNRRHPNPERSDTNCGDDSNVSHESDNTEYDDSERSANNSSTFSLWGICSLVFVVIIGFIFIIGFIVSLYYLCSNSNNESTLLKRYKHQINSILRRNFTNEYEHGTNTKAVLRLIGEKWVYQKPVEPYVVLIAGTKADMLADALGDVFSNVTEKGEIDRIFCNEYKERQLLESEVTNSLSKYSKSVVLHGIDKLRGHAPLYLHSLSDPDHSPFRSALILLTINLSFGSHPSCEEAISSHLLNIWDSDYIGEDQIRPILSRISSFLICLEE